MYIHTQARTYNVCMALSDSLASSHMNEVVDSWWAAGDDAVKVGSCAAGAGAAGDGAGAVEMLVSC